MSADTRTMTLTEFLLARIDERKALYTSRRDLEECIALERIISDDTLRYGEADHGLSVFAQRILGYLAQPYADHPDYREEWRP